MENLGDVLYVKAVKIKAGVNRKLFCGHYQTLN